MTPEARQRARALAHKAMRQADKDGCCNLPACAFEHYGGDAETILCDRLTDTLAPYLEALEVAREALKDLSGYLQHEPADEYGSELCIATLARIAALTPLPGLEATAGADRGVIP
jgi:hypothetical protein